MVSYVLFCSAKKRVKLTPTELAVGEELIKSNKRRRELVELSYNRCVWEDWLWNLIVFLLIYCWDLIHQSRPSKNWLFEPPNPVQYCPFGRHPCPRASGPYRAKTSETQHILQSGRPWTNGGPQCGGRYLQSPKHKIFYQNRQRWMSCLRDNPPGPRPRFFHFCLRNPKRKIFVKIVRDGRPV